MKDAMVLFGYFMVIAAMCIGALLFVAGLYAAVFGTIGGVLYLFVKSIIGLFE